MLICEAFFVCVFLFCVLFVVCSLAPIVGISNELLTVVDFSCRMFYGPGGPYALFAGRDASRALALMSFEPEDLTGNIEGLSASELDVLQDWEYKFMEKYVKVGQLVGAERNQIETEPTENGDKIQEAKHIEENGTQQPPTSE